MSSQSIIKSGHTPTDRRTVSSQRLSASRLADYQRTQQRHFKQTARQGQCDATTGACLNPLKLYPKTNSLFLNLSSRLRSFMYLLFFNSMLFSCWWQSGLPLHQPTPSNQTRCLLSALHGFRKSLLHTYPEDGN